MNLPSFPVDDATLDLIDQALDPQSHGDPDATSSSLYPLLEFLSLMGGSDPAAVESEDGGIRMMRDPAYGTHDLISALVAEVRRLRSGANSLAEFRDKLAALAAIEDYIAESGQNAARNIRDLLNGRGDDDGDPRLQARKWGLEW